MQKRRILKVLAATTLWSALAAVLSGGPALAFPEEEVAPPAVFTVFLDPAGVDTNPGTRSRPINSLARAEEIVAAARPQTDVEIRIKQGTYVQPSHLTWDTFVPNHTISFLPIDYQYGQENTFAGRPVFSGAGTGGYWLQVKLPAGHPGGATNMRFYFLKIQDYANGLVFNGKVTTNANGVKIPADAGLNHNTVYGMYFDRIGSRYAPTDAGRGSLTLQSSSDNLVRNNHFTNVINIESELAQVHAIYVAHHASRNAIKNNRFESVSGDPVRLRNDSNDNNVTENTFAHTGIRGIYSEWFCGDDCVANNPGHPRECASHGNWFRYNTMGNSLGYRGDQIPAWVLTPAGNNLTGGEGCSNGGQDRVRTAANID